jgi:hypothetical protein
LDSVVFTQIGFSTFIDVSLSEITVFVLLFISIFNSTFGISTFNSTFGISTFNSTFGISTFSSFNHSLKLDTFSSIFLL